MSPPESNSAPPVDSSNESGADFAQELQQARQRETAAAEILRIVSNSPNDAQPVFDAIVQSGLKLFPDAAIFVALPEGDHVKAAALAEPDPARAEAWRQRFPFPLTRDYMHGLAIIDGRMVDIPDVAKAPAELAVGGQNFLASGYRAITIKPMMLGNAAIGALSVVRLAPGPLSDDQLAMLETFAAQAVIAIENTRRVNELRQRTTDLAEALEQQTATSNVLKVISRSTFDLRTVLDTLTRSGAELCEAYDSAIMLREGDVLVSGSHYGPIPIDFTQWKISRQWTAGRAVMDRKAIHVSDLSAGEQEFPEGSAMALRLGHRTILSVPLMRENEAIGCLTLRRKEVRPFSDKQIELAETFADQAVIAIENTRLLSDLRQRTADLAEALEQQTATADVLKVISSSPGELQSVFDAMMESAVRTCRASFGVMVLCEGDGFRRVAMHNPPPGLASAQQRDTFIPRRIAPALNHLMRTRQVLHVPDMAAKFPDDPLARLAGARTVLAVPMLKEGEPVGFLGIYRLEVDPFNDKQVALLTNFAAQAVIAIENTRLLNELRESLERQTATSEVLRVINSSSGELQPVFAAMLANATRLCEASYGAMWVREGEGFRSVALHGPLPPEFARALGGIVANPNTTMARVEQTRQPVQIPDMREGRAYLDGDAMAIAAAEIAGIRTLLSVPMFKEDALVGVITIYRKEVRPFTDKQVELVKNFAAQAVIAIENTRLLNELHRRTDDLTESLEQQTATSEVLKVISGSPGALDPVFQAMLENAVKLCQAKFGVLYRYEDEACYPAAMVNAPPAYADFVRARGKFMPQANNALDRVLKSKQLVHSVDVSVEEVPTPSANLAGARSQIIVPMLKEKELIGAIAIFRQEVRPFSEKQIALLTNFAAQAVIAIENARLLNELRTRTGELEQSYGVVRQQASQLERQSEELRTLNQQLEKRVSEQVDEIERMGRLRRFLSPQVADLVVASGAEKQLESHRREITALFCDLRGFTGFSESADPEDVMALLREYHAAIGEIIFKHGGTLERFVGDGVMVIFNDPIPLPNPALHAVQMALEMRCLIGVMIEKWRRMGHDLGFGIGIAHGYATLGTIGFEGRFDYAAIGTVANVASRLCDEAKPGQILISPRVLMAVEETVRTEPVGEFALKGIRRPLAVYNVVTAM